MDSKICSLERNHDCDSTAEKIYVTSISGSETLVMDRQNKRVTLLADVKIKQVINLLKGYRILKTLSLRYLSSVTEILQF
jgi:hypothetical protein